MVARRVALKLGALLAVAGERATLAAPGMSARVVLGTFRKFDVERSSSVGSKAALELGGAGPAGRRKNARAAGRLSNFVIRNARDPQSIIIVPCLAPLAGRLGPDGFLVVPG
jgi:hypothetical protein